MKYLTDLREIKEYSLHRYADTYWGDLGLDARGIHRELKKFLAKRDTRIAEVSQLVSNYGGEHLVDNDGLLKRDAATRQELDKWMRNSMICTWGDEPLPLNDQETRALKDVWNKNMGEHPVDLNVPLSRKEILQKRQHELSSIDARRSRQEECYEMTWHSIRTDLGIYIAESFIEDFPEHEWDVVRLARKKNFMTYGSPIIVPKNAPRTGYYPEVSLMHSLSAVYPLRYYRDGHHSFFCSNEIFHIDLLIFLPVSGMYEVLEESFNRTVPWERKPFILPDVPRSWIDSREALSNAIKQLDFDYSNHKNMHHINTINVPQHLRESGKIY